MINMPEIINNVKKLLVNIEIEPKAAPIVNDPVSPINIFAGCLLYFRKPIHKPDIA